MGAICFTKKRHADIVWISPSLNKTVSKNETVVFINISSRYGWGWPFFHEGWCLCRLLQRPLLVSRKSAVLQHLQCICHWLCHAVVGKDCPCSLEKVKSRFFFSFETTTILFIEVCADCIRLAEGKDQHAWLLWKEFPSIGCSLSKHCTGWLTDRRIHRQKGR